MNVSQLPPAVLEAMLAAAELAERDGCADCGGHCDARAAVEARAVHGGIEARVTCWSCRQRRAA